MHSLSNDCTTAIFVYTAVDSTQEIVYFYDTHENAVSSVGIDGTNVRPFVTNGKIFSYSNIVWSSSAIN